MLTEASQDQAILGSGQSPQAQALRDAIKSAQDGVAGDLARSLARSRRRSFHDALNRNDTSAMLRLQNSLEDQANTSLKGG
jgi:hypothetical protein